MKPPSPDESQACSAPIVCTLGAGDYRDRLNWISELNRSALISDRLDGLSLVLTYAGDARPHVEELVRREQACCAFLTFAMQERHDTFTLAVTAPEAAREAAETLFEQFRAR